MGLWTSIKERRITQIVVGYLAAGWMALAVVDQFADRGVVPDVVYRVALTLYLFGMPAALLLGWYHGEKGRQRATGMERVQLGLIAALGLAASGWVVSEARQEAARLRTLEDVVDLRDVTVLYFAARDPELRALADGFTEGLISSLAGVSDLQVSSVNAVAPFRGTGLSADSVGRLLGSGVVIAGELERANEELRVSVRVIDAASATPLASAVRAWPADDVLTARDELAEEVARQFREQLGQEIDLRSARRGTENTSAWLLLQRAGKLDKDARALLGQDDVGGAVEAYRTAAAALERASEADPRWPEPLVARGWVSYELSWLAHSVDDAAARLAEALDWGERALAIDRVAAPALELRGTTRYRLWTLQVAGPEEADALLRDARSDLEEATRFDGSLASAYSTLSHLYYQVGDPSGAVLAARKAYEEDAYLRVADGVLWRLYSGSYDLDEFDAASDWCDEGRRRFAHDFRFVECRIWLLTMTGAEPDIAGAWEHLAEMATLVPEPARPFYLPGARMAVGAVIGLAGLPDSARVVMRAARAEAEGTEAESELLSVEAAMRTLIGDSDEAIELLRRYVVANPGHFGEGRRLHWWWRALESDDRFEALRRLN